MWVRSFFIDLLPARSGLAAIPAALRVVWQVPLASGIGTLAGAVVAEMASLGIVILLAVLWASSSLGQNWIAAMLLLGIALVLVLPTAVFLAERLVVTRRSGRVVDAVKRVTRETYALKQRRILLPVLGYTILTRIFKYGGLFILFRALVPVGLNPMTFLMSMIAAESTSALPIQGLAGVGTWEAAWLTVSTSFGLEKKLAVASGFAIHLVVLGWEIMAGAAGLVVLVRLQSRRRDS
jgi:uncharacterized membrane protein YbhN (UPF0104 family)